MRFIKDRLGEPSTYAGLGGMLAMFGIQVPNELWSAIAEVAGGIMFIICAIKGEKKNS